MRHVVLLLCLWTQRVGADCTVGGLYRSNATEEYIGLTTIGPYVWAVRDAATLYTDHLDADEGNWTLAAGRVVPPVIKMERGFRAVAVQNASDCSLRWDNNDTWYRRSWSESQTMLSDISIEAYGDIFFRDLVEGDDDLASYASYDA